MHSKFHSFSSIFLAASISMLLATSSVMAAENKNLQKNMKSKTQPLPKPKWEQEPSSFMGIDLDRTQSISHFEKCPDESFADQAKRDKLCLEENEREGTYRIFGINKVPLLNDNAGIEIFDIAGVSVVGNVSVTFQSDVFSQIKEMLTAKYGSPHKIEIEKLQTKGGAEFDNIVLFWVGEKVTIKVDSLARRLFLKGSIYDYGEINVHTNEYITKKYQEINDATQKSAAGL